MLKELGPDKAKKIAVFGGRGNKAQNEGLQCLLSCIKEDFIKN